MVAAAAAERNAQSVAFRPLPAPPPSPSPEPSTSIVLFYQYAEPPWSEAHLKRVLAEVQRLAAEHAVTGRYLKERTQPPPALRGHPSPPATQRLHAHGPGAHRTTDGAPRKAVCSVRRRAKARVGVPARLGVLLRGPPSRAGHGTDYRVISQRTRV